MDEGAGPIRHVPVMVEPVIELLDCKPGGIYVDATLGGGGIPGPFLSGARRSWWGWIGTRKL